MKKLYTFSLISLVLMGNLIKSQTCSSPATVANTNLIAHYPFTNGSGTDVSGNNLNLALSGNSSGIGYLGSPNQGVLFNGGVNGGSAAHNNVMNVTNQLSIACWFYSGYAATGSMRLVDKLAGTTAGNYMMDIYSGHIRFFVKDALLTSSSSLLNNTWYYVVGTYDGSNAKLYINDNLPVTTALTGNLTSNTSPLKIGADQASGNYFNGYIDDIKLYSRALSEPEIATFYQKPVWLTQPSNTTSCGTNATLTGNASYNDIFGTPATVSYKWKKGNSYLSNNSVYSGTTTGQLSISNATASEAGKYVVEAYSANCAMTTSDTAILTLGGTTTNVFNNSGLVLQYPLDGVSTNPTTNQLNNSTDISGNKLNLSFLNGGSSAIVSTTDQYNVANRAVSFAGTGTGASSPHSTLMNVNNLTLSLWFKSPAIVNSQRLIDKLNGTTTGNFLLDIYQSKFRFFCGSVTLNPSTVLSSNTWYHVATTYDGANVSLYLNGTLLQSTPYTGTLTSNTSALRIGIDQNNGNVFVGSMNDLRFYSRALSAADIAFLSNAPDVLENSISQDKIATGTYRLIVKVGNYTGNYQWKKDGLDLVDGTNINGATNDTLILSNINTDNLSNYSVSLPSTTLCGKSMNLAVPQIIRGKYTVTHTSIGGLSPALTRINVGDTIIIYNAYANGRILNTILPDNSTQQKTLAKFASDTVIATLDGVYTIGTSGTTAVYVLTYPQTTFNILYNNNQQRFQPNPLDARFMDAITVSYQTTVINGVTLKKPDNTTVAVTVGSQVSPGPAITLDQAGVYTLQVGSITSTINSVKSAPVVTSIEETNLGEETISVYPNPVKDILNVKGKAEILNLSGQKVAEGENKIDLSHLENGLYLVRIGSQLSKLIKE